MTDKAPEPADHLADDLLCMFDPIYWSKYIGQIDLEPWQERVLKSRHRFITLCCNRQCGKTTIAAVRAAHMALYQPRSKTLIIAPSMRQTLEVFKVIEGFVFKGDGGDKRDEDNKKSLILSNGSQIYGVPASPDTIRGFSAIDLLIEDEAAFVDDAINDAVTPMIDRSRGTMMLLSSPNGQQGHFFRAVTGSGDWFRERITWKDCPWLTKERMDQLREEKGDNYVRQEYECEFLSADDAVFLADQIEAALKDTSGETWDV